MTKDPDLKKFALKRETMIAQLRSMGIKSEPLLDAVKNVPRHLFLDNALIPYAYENKTLPIGDSQTISSPYTIAKMIELAEIKPSDKILEIGTGSGYQSALLSLISEKVYTVDRLNRLSNRARKVFNLLKISNIVSLVGDGVTSAKKWAPFDVIIVSAITEQISKELIGQIADKGRIIAPVKDNSSSNIYKLVKENDKVRIIKDIECSFVPLVRRNGQ